ncbi:glycosyltransferase [Thiothrix subterranea]|uniref:glycosyltransferase n=1 Tax=Thiothrix subterranea TaxID=2735563 RepID=UPI00192C88F3|nr:glycosyltransferase [Thiothrix subterranea]QQZ28399.1 glycosyltransferase [Thiothrix subterranea]
MKVIHVAESFAAGVLHFVAQLTHAMPEHEHIVIHGKRPDTPNNYASLFSKKVKLLVWHGVSRDISPLGDVLALLRLMRLLSKHDADVIHLHSSKAGFLGRIAAKLLWQSGKVIYTPHGVAFLRQDVTSLKQTLFIGLEKVASLCSGQVIACSASEAASFHAHGIAADYINNGITCARLPESALSKSDDAPCTIAVVGRISNQKNPARFNAIAQAFANEPQFRFVWVGDGELRHLLTAPNIRCTGWVSTKEVAQELQMADIYLSTSSWEGLPLSGLEAMCYRLPMVLSECTGHTDLVQDGRNGYLFQHDDTAVLALKTLADDAALRERLGCASRELLEQQFTVQQMADSYRRIYIHSSSEQQPIGHDASTFTEFKNPSPKV